MKVCVIQCKGQDCEGSTAGYPGGKVNVVAELLRLENLAPGGVSATLSFVLRNDTRLPTQASSLLVRFQGKPRLDDANLMPMLAIGPLPVIEPGGPDVVFSAVIELPEEPIGVWTYTSLKPRTDLPPAALPTSG